MNKKKYKIGYTTGVFDLFHIGHLNILKNAKEQCKFLIVGVTIDELVLEYKKITPIIPYAERFAIIGACRYVDRVVPQENYNKFDAFLKYKYDVMFVGDDWKGKPRFVRVEKKLKEHNSTIIYFPYTKSTSSTIIRKLIKSNLSKS